MFSDNFIIIDPLFEHLKVLIQSGDRKCLEKSITLYGSETDMDRLQQIITKVARNNPDKHVLVDLSPIPSLGAQKRFLSLLELNKKTPFIIAIRSSMAIEQIQLLNEIPLLITDDATGEIKTYQLNSMHSVEMQKIYDDIKKENNIHIVRCKYFEELILALSNKFVQKPPDGSRYIQLHDMAWANQWIDVKSILGNTDLTLQLAYHMGYSLTKGYTKKLKEDIILVGNNTAYILGMFFNKIFDDKKLIIIDKLGPYPNFSYFKSDILHYLNKKQVLIIEDVIASGREIDLLALLILTNNGEIGRASCIFDLECASSRFIKSELIISLVKPSQHIGYERIPKYIGDKYVK